MQLTQDWSGKDWNWNEMNTDSNDCDKRVIGEMTAVGEWQVTCLGNDSDSYEMKRYGEPPSVEIETSTEQIQITESHKDYNNNERIPPESEAGLDQGKWRTGTPTQGTMKINLKAQIKWRGQPARATSRGYGDIQEPGTRSFVVMSFVLEIKRG